MRVGLVGGTLSYRDQELTLHRRGRPEQVWMNLDYSPVPDESGRPAGVLAIVIETTERVHAERELRNERDRTRGVLDGMAEGFCLLDHEFRVLDINAEGMSLETRPCAEILGRSHWDLYPGSEDSELGRSYKRAMSKRVPVSLEHRYQWEDGRSTWVDMRAYPVAEGLAVFYRDVTDRKQSEADLAEGEERLRLATEAAEIGFWDVDAVNDVLIWPPRVKAMFGISADAPVSMADFYAGLHPDDRERTGEAYAAAADPEQRALYDVEYRTIGKEDGVVRWVAAKGRGVFDVAGTCLRLIGTAIDVSERRYAEAALRESEDNYRNTVELNPQTTWTATPDGQLDRVAERWREWTGGSGLGASWGEAMHPDDLDRSVETWVRSVTTGVPYDIEHRARMVSGEYRWMHSRAYPRRDEEGRIVKWYGSTEDIHERKRAEEALRESEGRLRGLTQAVPNQIWTAGPDGALDWFNDRVYAYAGSEPGMLDGPSAWGDLVHPEDLPDAANAWASCLAGSEVYETEFRIRRADGAYRWFLVRAVPIRLPDGKIARWIGTNTDIEDRRQQTDELASLNSTLEMRVAERTADRDRMWRLSTDLMLVARFDAMITAVNPAWTVLLGWSEEDLLGRAFLDLVHPDDVGPTLSAVGNLSDGRKVLRFENRYRAKDDTYRWVSWTAVPDSELIHAVGRDISAEKAASDELDRTQEALRQSQKMEAVGQLTGGLAHDFNNLLAGISGSLEMMQARIAQGRVGDVERYMVAAQGASKRAAALTHRLLAFSRRQTLAPKPTAINALIVGMEDLIRRTVGPAISLENVATAGVWPVLVDPNQLENALLNLCINARDAMPDGGNITIETANRWLDERAARERDLKPGQYVSMCVSDNGAGMPKDVVERAFDPFFTTKPIGVGTGLGLSMIYGFARQSGGQVHIYSEVGKGTMVCVYLPRHHGETETDETSAEGAPELRVESGETVLVVDDEPLVRMLVVDVLEDLGYVAIEAGDGPQALKILHSDVRIDLLITDVGLPNGLNGRQVADAARELRPDLKVLFITGYAENAVLNHGHLAPGMQVVTKPFQMDELGRRISKLMEEG